MKLIPALGAAARAARESAGVGAEEISVALKESGATTYSKDKLIRFERGEHYAALDQTVNGYAKTLGVSVFDLWDDAIRRAHKAQKDDPADPANSDPPLEAETLRRAGGSPRSAQPKARKRSGR